MAKHNQASSDQAAAYRHEATIRVTALSAAGVVSVIAAVVVAGSITLFFPHVSHHTRVRIFSYSFGVAFVIVCGFTVYRTDQVLNRKFNQNP